MGLVKYNSEQKKCLRENLKKLTEEQGLAKTDLADKLGYAYNTVISWFSSRDFARNCRPDRGECPDVKEFGRYNEKSKEDMGNVCHRD